MFSIDDDQRRHRMAVGYAENKVMFNDKPDEWRMLPVTKKGLLMIPLTKDACDRHTPPPPGPLVQRKSRRKHKDCACAVEDCKADH